MKIGKNMAETLKFVYVILFISLFLMIIVSDSFNPLIRQYCVTDKDCPKFKKYNIRCRKGFCVQVNGG
ncbi:putative Late nodulin [Medicago truncatula]|nr:putative Late nodulin [Medicago truncatula]